MSGNPNYIKCKCEEVFEERDFTKHFPACVHFKNHFKTFDTKFGEILREFSEPKENLLIVRVLLSQYNTMIENKIKQMGINVGPSNVNNQMKQPGFPHGVNNNPQQMNNNIPINNNPIRQPQQSGNNINANNNINVGNFNQSQPNNFNKENVINQPPQQQPKVDIHAFLGSNIYL